MVGESLQWTGLRDTEVGRSFARWALVDVGQYDPCLLLQPLGLHRGLGMTCVSPPGPGGWEYINCLSAPRAFVLHDAMLLSLYSPNHNQLRYMCLQFLARA
jgi:hypothetical protein